ncbi:Crp/Fnr family transcriptional regulator [Streptomyces sp. 021-4]|uniref:Crp/Fnr family transcriptional regulator n=1 Tax=Streptomyces sp. 021-4 TaxID=2789260 RepID=UPI0039F61ABC
MANSEFPPRINSLLLGGSLYDRNEVTGRIRHAVSGPRALRPLMELNPFLAELSPTQRQDLLLSAQVRTYQRGNLLRGSGGSMVHIVLGGCVLEEPMYGDVSTTRIQGAGAVLGDVELLDETVLPPTTRCLSTTVTMSVGMDRMRFLMEHLPSVTMAVGKTVAERIVVSEKVYNRHALSSEQRLAGLFVYLLERCSVPSSRYGRMLEGLSQENLAAALSVSRATVEGAVRALRKRTLLVTGYRTYEFPSERKLAELGKVRIPQQTVTGEASDA